MRQRGIHLLLVLALLLFSWAELEHDTDLDAHQGGETCEMCVFASPLGHGATPAATLALPNLFTAHTPHVLGAAVILPPAYRHTLGQRGPPLHT